MRIFIDSDVIISSLVSSKGAAFILLNNPNVLKLISNYSLVEVDEVIKRLELSDRKFIALKNQYLALVESTISLKEVKSEFKEYVLDAHDAHIIAGANFARTRFLITYNLRDYKLDKIKKDLGIVILTPGLFLQYLRSIS